ncbi:MAG: dipicolinate synthase subunit B [Thermoanaerobacteraceae bacterium]|nr:dipicolinate synthase subunit B [Thermoanaerobacteraceae bacterium]
MDLKGKTVGFAVTGSHCTLGEVMPYVQELINLGADVIPIVSHSVLTTDTRFGLAKQWLEQLTAMTGKDPLTTIVEVESIGPKSLLDVLVIAPCSGNTLAKLANGITDGAVLMAAKAQLRNCKPVVMAVSTNDGLGFNAKNIGILVNTFNVFLVPFGQDNPVEKPNSLMAKMDLIPETVKLALEGKQIQPVLIQY